MTTAATPPSLLVAALLAAAAAAPFAAAPAAAQDGAAIAWDRKLWDPAGPQPGQVDLPLPCGGGMAFLPVETPVDLSNPMDDRSVQLGGATPDTGYMDYFRTEHLRGGFELDGKSVYYLAKYEVTQDQYAALAGDACPEPGRRGARPMGGLSWFDAIEFTRAWSEWLRAEAPAALPETGGGPAYVRLPTEVEWEYAARGGAALDDADFRAPLPPMPEGVSEYAWHQGRRSSNGALRPIGMRKPNPLGFHGLFGGVEELALEPFRLNRFGRRHGQIGGFVTRGGSIASYPEELRSSLRSEWAFFAATDGKATALETFGMRPMLSTVVNGSLAETNRIRDQWMAQFEELSGEGGGDNPVPVLDELIRNTTNLQTRNELEVVRAQIIEDRRARDEAQARSMRLSLLSGATLINWIRQERAAMEKNARTLGVVENSLAGGDLPEDLVPRYEKSRDNLRAAIARHEENLARAESIFLSSLYDITAKHSPEAVKQEGEVLAIELDGRDQGGLVPDVVRMREAVEMVRAAPDAPREEIVRAAIR
ncbi:formylglycine-generating enzyme family protein [Rhodovulum sp. DZ06]|uniref:formylglycine-generating enzyme family protein n=1 Tax=Rhodovulum sp. DZ06 TaxID=3425126 RepID=UPI003D3388AE